MLASLYIQELIVKASIPSFCGMSSLDDLKPRPVRHRLMNDLRPAFLLILKKVVNAARLIIGLLDRIIDKAQKT